MEAKLEKEFPLHFAVWKNDLETLEDLLRNENIQKDEVEKKDPRGRTPLMLAVTLGRAECSERLLSHGADATVENRGYWGVAHEAVATGDPQLLQLILQYRDFQRSQIMKLATGNLLQKLKDTQDFYTEMRWEFTSWVPFVSRVCPSDTYKVYKSGSFVRIDTTLVGFDPSGQWERGNQSFIFKSSEDGKALELAVVDHELKSVQLEKFTTEDDEADELRKFRPSESEIASRLTSPIVTTYVDVEKISFERAKGGLLWSKDKEEEINGYPSKIYSASQVDLVTKTRTEHLTERDKAEQESRNSTPMDSLLKFAMGTETKHEDKPDLKGDFTSFNPNGITAENYFNSEVPMSPEKDIGRPKQIARRAQSFKAQIWLAQDYPLDLQDQIAPIIDLMAANNTHFARLKNFIQLQLPSGFPVKIEIPLYHVINAKVTFGNIFGRETPVEHVTYVDTKDDPERKEACVIDESIFELPAHYHGMERNNPSRSRGSPPLRNPRYYQNPDDDVMMQWAIQQSLREGASDDMSEADVLAAIGGGSVVNDSTMNDSSELGTTTQSEGVNPLLVPDSDLETALQLSIQEEQDRLRRVQEQEEEDLRLAIELSMKIDQEQ